MIKISVTKEFEEKFKNSIKQKEKEYLEAVGQALNEVDGVEAVKQGYNESGLRVVSGQLMASFYEKNIVQKDSATKEVCSTAKYARIQDVGGFTGKNHRTYIRPKLYARNTIPKLIQAIHNRIKELWGNK